MLIRGSVYLTFLLPNAAFIGGRRLKEKIRYIFLKIIRKSMEKKQETLLEICVYCYRLCKVYIIIQQDPNIIQPSKNLVCTQFYDSSGSGSIGCPTMIPMVFRLNQVFNPVICLKTLNDQMVKLSPLLRI